MSHPWLRLYAEMLNDPKVQTLPSDAFKAWITGFPASAAKEAFRPTGRPSRASTPEVVTRTNADGSTETYGGGSAQKSAGATVSVTGSTGSATASVTPVRGAVGYAWFWGAAGSKTLGAVTTLNSVAITANAAGAQTAASLPSSDNNRNAKLFDGLLTQIANPSLNAYYNALATGTAGVGTSLTSDGAGGINEIEAAFAWFYDNLRLSPDTLFVSSRGLLTMNKLIVANGGAPLIRFNMDGANPSRIDAGAVIGSYLNKITNQRVKIEVHPNMPQGTIMFFSESIPYTLSGVQNVLQVRARKEYHQIEWPLRSRKWERRAVEAEAQAQKIAQKDLKDAAKLSARKPKGDSCKAAEGLINDYLGGKL